ncbi:hypothetical protein MCOR19_011752 [Pyricularia oryzae]|nr:hypothetical protein MCOR19_011752 [Pyricularia oryzae]KAI6465960.1 hypothetical protein MCOR18_010015 [Pyricularia oryzae]
MPAQETPTRPLTRLACERCRSQKLRCEWPKDGKDRTCNRCRQRGLCCTRTLSCRPGRPSRLREANAAPVKSPSSVEQKPLPLLMSPLSFGQQQIPLLPPSTTAWSPSYSQSPLIDQTPDGSSMYSPGFNPIMTPQDVDFTGSLSSEWGSYNLVSGVLPDENADDQQVGWSLPSPSPSSLQEQQPCQNPLQAVSPQQEMYHPTSEPQQQGLHSLPEQFFAPDPSQYSPSPSSQDHHTVQPTFADGDVCNIASLTSHLFELILLAPYASPWDGRQGSLPGLIPAVADGPTNILILSCYAKIFEGFRQLMSGVYHRLLGGQTTTNLYELKIDDVAVGGDGHLEILILIQIITHKLNTLGALLGVPDKHRVGVGDDAMAGEHGAAEACWEVAALDDMLSGGAGSRHVFGDEGNPMPSAAAAFGEELRLIRGLLDHKARSAWPCHFLELK